MNNISTSIALESFIEGKYDEAITMYTYLISSDSCNRLNYWYLGLSQLLQGKETESQATWFAVIESVDIDQIDLLTDELCQVLEQESLRKEVMGESQEALLIRSSLAEINPYIFSNLTAIVLLSIKLNKFTSTDLSNLDVIDLLDSEDFVPISKGVLLEILEKVLTFGKYDHFISHFVEKLCLAHIHHKDAVINLLFEISTRLVNQDSSNISTAINILEICSNLDSQNLEILMYLLEQFLNIKNYNKSIEIGRRLYSVANDGKTIDKVFACQWLIKTLIVNCNHWEEAEKLNQECENNLKQLIQEPPLNLSLQEASLNLLSIGYYSPYFNDLPQETHLLRSKVRELSYARIYATEKERIDRSRTLQIIRRKSETLNKKIKIGYLSSSLRRHSVGHLARFLFQYHDRNKFELYAYFVNYKENDPLQVWFEKQFYKSYKEIADNPYKIANQIQKDRIDILVDLDSITSTICSNILAFKPAPIQITWLGWDAAGQSNVDYFIADPYVLPESAQEYYTEKIWRLPHTYVAVDGFDVATPTIRRSLLNIPDDAVIYLSAQAAMKRHPDCIRMQMKIIKSVPNSYLLIKSIIGNQESLQEFFCQIAKSEDVSVERLRFLPFTSSEEEHRANLSIADVVLDTYPYNGATHTMETLWMGIPIVTRVGQQFAARNSYTMMVNAGICEGIAWRDEEYIEWGIKLGTNIGLRQQVAWKLKQGRQTAPLWDARQFTKEMENAYIQMWAKYLESDIPQLETDTILEHRLLVEEAAYQKDQGISFALQGQLDTAILYFKNAMSLNPNLDDAYYNLGVALVEKGNIEQALMNFQKTTELNPNHANGFYNLGLTMFKLGRIEESINSYFQSLAILPNDVQTHHALGNAFFAQCKWDRAITCYQSALNINSQSSDICCSIGAALSEQGNLQEAILSLQLAIDNNPQNAQAYCNLGHVLSKTKQLTEATYCYQTAIEIQPNLGSAYWNFGNDILSNPKSGLSGNHKLQRQIAEQFTDNCTKTDRVRSLVHFISTYTHSGLGDISIHQLSDLESYIFHHNDKLNALEIESIYISLLFIMSSIRDNLKLNNQLYKLIGNLYLEKVIKSKIDLTKSKIPKNDKPIVGLSTTRKLRIGILSPHFVRHAVGWCGLDVIRELSILTPHIYLYATNSIETDDRSKLFEQVAEKFYWYEDDVENTYSGRLSKVITDILNDDLDILLDLDSLTISLNTHVLSRQLATVCVSWLGFDAPFISADNYCLCDWYTHPEGMDQYYVEKLLRLPDAHMAISGFESVVINRDESREKLGITAVQVAYLYAASGRKFNRDSAKACIDILRQVPNSVLLHKGNGDREVISSIYQEICDEMGLDGDRIKFLPSYKTEEEHRSIYSIADVFLDSYPYNGGSHNLEVLWFNLPVVTKVGEQSFARMGYSFLQSLNIDEGIAYSWDEYIQWGVRYGLDSVLRNSIKQRLIDSKHPKTLAPLWNPQKLARDMYNLLKDVINIGNLDQC